MRIKKDSFWDGKKERLFSNIKAFFTKGVHHFDYGIYSHTEITLEIYFSEEKEPRIYSSSTHRPKDFVTLIALKEAIEKWREKRFRENLEKGKQLVFKVKPSGKKSYQLFLSSKGLIIKETDHKRKRDREVPVEYVYYSESDSGLLLIFEPKNNSKRVVLLASEISDGEVFLNLLDKVLPVEEVPPSTIEKIWSHLKYDFLAIYLAVALFGIAGELSEILCAIGGAVFAILGMKSAMERITVSWTNYRLKKAWSKYRFPGVADEKQ